MPTTSTPIESVPTESSRTPRSSSGRRVSITAAQASVKTRPPMFKAAVAAHLPAPMAIAGAPVRSSGSSDRRSRSPAVVSMATLIPITNVDTRRKTGSTLSATAALARSVDTSTSSTRSGDATSGVMPLAIRRTVAI